MLVQINYLAIREIIELLRKADQSDKELVAKILVSAFAPLTAKNSVNLIVKQDDKRLERMHNLMEYLFDRSMRHGEVYLSDNDKACILIKIEHNTRVSLQSLKEDIKLVRNCIGITRVFGALKRQRIVHRHYPKTPHVRPVILGAMDIAKGRGSAARLLLQVHEKYKQSQIPIVLDAADKTNVKLYQKFGFRIISEEESLGFPIYFLQLN